MEKRTWKDQVRGHQLGASHWQGIRTIVDVFRVSKYIGIGEKLGIMVDKDRLRDCVGLRMGRARSQQKDGGCVRWYGGSEPGKGLARPGCSDSPRV